MPVIAALRAALPDTPISVDTTKPAVAEAALAAGADLINDVWGVGDDDALARLAADHGVPLVVMHNRAEPRYRTFMAELLADLQRAIERALALGVAVGRPHRRPGLRLRQDARPQPGAPPRARRAAHPRAGRSCSARAASRPSGASSDLPADQRLEATLATTALGIAGGADIVRVHDVEANVRAARMSDAIVRGDLARPGPRRRPDLSDRIVLANMRFQGRHGVLRLRAC